MSTLTTNATLADVLGDIDFPATKDDLLLVARRGGASDADLGRLARLPEGSYNGRWEVKRALPPRVL